MQRACIDARPNNTASHVTELTKLLDGLLVLLAGGDGLGGLLGLLDDLLEGDNPAIALGGVGGLERVLVAVELEGEDLVALLGDLSSLSLQDLVSM